MTVYVMFVKESTLDDSYIEEYRRVARAARINHPMSILAAGTPETWEGDETPSVVLAEFPSREAAKAWYHSPAYQEAKKIREKTGQFRVLIVEGIN